MIGRFESLPFFFSCVGVSLYIPRVRFVHYSSYIRLSSVSENWTQSSQALRHSIAFRASKITHVFVPNSCLAIVIGSRSYVLANTDGVCDSLQERKYCTRSPLYHRLSILSFTHTLLWNLSPNFPSLSFIVLGIWTSRKVQPQIASGRLILSPLGQRWLLSFVDRSLDVNSTRATHYTLFSSGWLGGLCSPFTVLVILQLCRTRQCYLGFFFKLCKDRRIMLLIIGTSSLIVYYSSWQCLLFIK